MNPVTKQMERNGWTWDSLNQVYKHKVYGFIVRYDEAANWQKKDKITEMTEDLIKNHKAELRKAKR